jgi:murein DD-endopeptidase MepM/ murein hydrolase activator NlpD
MKSKFDLKAFKLLLIVMALTVAVLILPGCGVNASDIRKIEVVNGKTGEKIEIAKDSGTAHLIIDSINRKKKTGEDIPKLFSYDIFIDRNSQVEGYQMSFDTDNRNVFISKDSEVYKVAADKADELLHDENFSYAYIDRTMYEIYLYHNGEKAEIDTDYNWTYKENSGTMKTLEGSVHRDSNKIVFRQNDVLDFKFESDPDTQITRVYRDGKVVYTGRDISEAVREIRSDGEYLFETEVQWLQKNNSEHYGSQTVSFMVSADMPAYFTILSKQNYPGNILTVMVENLNEDETVKITSSATNVDGEVYKHGSSYAAIFPIGLDKAAGTYAVTAVFNESKSNEYTMTKQFEVSAKNFKVQYLTVSEELNESNNSNDAIIEFSKLVKPARSKSVSKKLWEGPFMMPVEGEITTDFAEIRYVNNEKSSSRHSGIDIAADAGTEVKAPNSGKVVFAMNGLLSPGNTIVIDHGMGLFTSYYHLESILVKAGEEVKKGDIIGTVGSTGFSTGPYLHYAVSIYNTYVNTYQPLSGIID